MAKQTTFEQTLKTLEDAVSRLEEGQLPLDQALDCFETGVQSANQCRKQLTRVEAKVERLLKSADGRLHTEALSPDET